MRIPVYLAALSVACGLALAAGPKQEPVTYVSGNLTGVVLNSGGSLIFATEKAMELKTGLASVAIPYSNISKAQLGAIREHSDSEPLYKVWALHKRIIHNQTQLLTVEFKTDEGEQRTMTVEVPKTAAIGVVDTILEYNASVDTGVKKEAAAAGQWWGDSMWRTSRNSDKWSKPAAGSQAGK